MNTCRPINPLKSLIVSKLKLPPILCNDAAPLRIARTATQLLVATQSNLWRVLHSDVGKRIHHKGRSVTIVNVHSDLRQIEDANGERIWISRRAVNKRELRKQRIARQYVQGIRRVFDQPCWTGEPRPSGKVAVPIESVFGDIPENTKRFLCFIGHEQARLLVKSAKETLLMSAATRLSNLKEFLHSRVAVVRKELTENLTVEILRRSQMSESRIYAVYDVVFEAKSVSEAAQKRNLDADSLKRTLRGLRAEVRPLVETQLLDRLSQDAELVASNHELDALKHSQAAIAGETGSSQDGRC